MKSKIIMVISFLFVCSNALADSSPCEIAAKDANLPASNKIQIARACEKLKVITVCNKLAEDKKLQGDKRIHFLQNCKGSVLGAGR